MESNNSLIPDPVTDETESSSSPSIHSEPEDGPLIPDSIDPKAETGSLVPDAAVIESSKSESSAPATPAKDYALPPEPTPAADNLPTAGILKDETTSQKKKPNFKLIGIIIGAVVVVAVLALLFIFVVLPIIEKNNRGSLDTSAKAIVVAESLDGDTKYALFDEKGQPISDFIYSSISDFADGYAVVGNETGEQVGIITAGGKMSIDFGTYETIEHHGNFFSAITDDGQRKLIRGNNEEIAKYTGDIKDFEEYGLIQVKVDDKYRLYRNSGEIAYEFKDEPSFETFRSGKVLIIKSDKHVDIIDLTTDQTILSRDISFDYDDEEISSNSKHIILRSKQDEDGQYHYGIYYKGKYKEIIAAVSHLFFGQADSSYGENSYYIYGKIDGKYSSNDYSDFLIMNDNFELVARPHMRSSSDSAIQKEYYWLDANTWAHAEYPIGRSDDRTVKIYADGKEVNKIEHVSKVNIIDDNYQLTIKGDNYCLYSTLGAKIECNEGRRYSGLDVNGNRVGAFKIYDKDYNVLADFEDIYGWIDPFVDDREWPVNNLYIVRYNSSRFVFLVDPKTGKDLTKRDLYQKIGYDRINNLYLATRDDGSTDIIDKDFNVLSTIAGQITMHQNYIEAKGGSTTELYTLGGEKFYTYK